LGRPRLATRLFAAHCLQLMPVHVAQAVQRTLRRVAGKS
jgi:hypothetical protein